jgi:3-oxoacyl-[acyl-carrier protein] reductase
MDLGLSNKRVLVTGGSRGIGRAIVASFLDEGSRVAMCARSVSGLESTANDFARRGELHHRAADLGDVESVNAYVEWAGETLGGIDIVISNVSAMSSDDLDIGYAVDVRGSQTLIHGALELMGDHVDANVVCIGSRAGSIGIRWMPAYAAYKAATVSLVKSTALQVARRGIRVNCVSPGDILFEGGTWADARDNNEKLYNSTLRQNPFRRLGTPEEIADVVTFVASERASFMTGSNVLVDGGATPSLQL